MWWILMEQVIFEQVKKGVWWQDTALAQTCKAERGGIVREEQAPTPHVILGLFRATHFAPILYFQIFPSFPGI